MTDPHSTDGPPALQARSRATIRQIVAAGTKLLERDGADALTVAAIADEAGVAVGSVYRRFGAKERLLAVIQSEFTEGFRREFERRMSTSHVSASTSPREVVNVAVGGLAETFHSHARLLRVFMLLGTNNPSVLEVGIRASRACGAAFHSLLQHTKGEIRRDDTAGAIDFSYRMVYAMCAHKVVHGTDLTDLESSSKMSWARMIDELSLAVALYLYGGFDTD
jgi:AcrR family transcriptional regulator